MVLSLTGVGNKLPIGFYTTCYPHGAQEGTDRFLMIFTMNIRIYFSIKYVHIHGAESSRLVPLMYFGMRGTGFFFQLLLSASQKHCTTAYLVYVVVAKKTKRLRFVDDWEKTSAIKKVLCLNGKHAHSQCST